jgi:hypothetical protein
MLILCWIWLQLCYNRKEFVISHSFTRKKTLTNLFRLFQYRVPAETREAQVILKGVLTKHYRDLGRPK